VNAADLDRLYLYHLQTVMQRTDRTLAATGFDALVIAAGVPPVQFLDDQGYPYKVNPQFKAWVPVVDNPGCFLVYRPGTRPRLLARGLLAQAAAPARGAVDRRGRLDRHCRPVAGGDALAESGEDRLSRAGRQLRGGRRIDQ
jgi:hypothetical protein